MKKKITLILTTILLLTSLVGCGEKTTTSNNATTTPIPQSIPKSTPTVTDEPKTKSSNKNKYLSSIMIDGDIAYFDMTPDEFVHNYNSTLTEKSKYVADSLSAPQYINGGMGIQQVPIYQYDVSNKAGGSIYTFVHTNENNKILELCVGVKKSLGNVNVDLVDVLYNQLGEKAMILTKLSENQWKTLADGLAKKIANRESSLQYYYNGIVLDSYSNENAVYFRISCITEDLYLKYK